MGQLFPIRSFILFFSALLTVSKCTTDVTTLGSGGGCLSRLFHVKRADDDAADLCPRNAGLSDVQGYRFGIQWRIPDLCDLRPGDYATSAPE
jgi:hypothetical protein